MTDSVAYKIFRPAEWAQFQADGLFSGSDVDLRDGYIHMSLADQLQGTLDKHYKNTSRVILAKIDLSLYGDHVKYEASRGGALFPHIYTDLRANSVSHHWDLSAGADHRYDITSILS